MNMIFGVMLFLWVAGWTVAAILALAKSPPVTDECHCRTEFRTGIRITN
jgi:hypothetical protein